MSTIKYSPGNQNMKKYVHSASHVRVQNCFNPLNAVFEKYFRSWPVQITSPGRDKSIGMIVVAVN